MPHARLGNGTFRECGGEEVLRALIDARPEDDDDDDSPFVVRGLPDMTSAVGWGRGFPKKQTKGTKSADL